MHVQLKNGKLLNTFIVEDVQQGFHDKKVVVIFLTNGTKFIEKFSTEEDAEKEVELVREALKAGGGLIQKDTYADLPEKGNPGSIYITKDTGQTYYWDKNTNTYIKTGTTGRTGIYSSSVNLPEKLGQSITINKSDLTEILAGAVPYSEGSEIIGPNQTHGVIISSTGTTVTVKTTADLVVNSFQQVPTESALPTTGQGNVIYYIQDVDEFRIWDTSENKYVPPAGLGGTMYLEKDITSNVTCGAAPAGTLFKEGMSLTEVAEKLLRKDITPTVTLTTTNGNKLFEMGTVLNGDNLKLTITNLAQVTVPMNEINFYVASNKINTTQIPFVTGTNVYQMPYTNNITTNTTLKGELVYSTNKVVSASQAVGFAYASYWGTINQGTLTSAELSTIIASIGLTGTNNTSAIGTFTKRLSNSKGFTINNLTLNDARYCYIIPTNIGGKLTSIKDGNNFEYLSNGGTLELTLTGVTAANGDSISYYAYILKDPTTGSGFKFIFS